MDKKNMYLYKYAAFNKPNILNLYNEKISFSLGANFNDPFDDIGASWTYKFRIRTISFSLGENFNDPFDDIGASMTYESNQKNGIFDKFKNGDYKDLFYELDKKIMSIFTVFYKMYQDYHTSCTKELEVNNEVNEILINFSKSTVKNDRDLNKNTKQSNMLEYFYSVEPNILFSDIKQYLQLSGLSHVQFFLIHILLNFYLKKEFCEQIETENDEEINTCLYLFKNCFFAKRTYFLCLEGEKKEDFLTQSKPGCSPAMWGYYAQNHTGFCIKYKKDRLEECIAEHLKILDGSRSPANLFTYLKDWRAKKFRKNYMSEARMRKLTSPADKGNAQYISQPVKYDIEETFKDEFYNQNTLSTIATLKNKNWEHEQEYRFGLVLDDDAHASNGYYTIDCPADAIDSIYFGLKASKEDKETIKKILREKNREIQFYQMAPSKDKPFSIEPQLEESLPKKVKEPVQSNKKTNVKNHIKNTEPEKEVELATG